MPLTQVTPGAEAKKEPAEQAEFHALGEEELDYHEEPEEEEWLEEASIHADLWAEEIPETPARMDPRRGILCSPPSAAASQMPSPTWNRSMGHRSTGYPATAPPRTVQPPPQTVARQMPATSRTQEVQLPNGHVAWPG